MNRLATLLDSRAPAATIVGTVEIVCGALVLLGLVTRLAAVPLIGEARTDFAMLLGSTFLVLVGAGPWSADARLARRART